MLSAGTGLVAWIAARDQTAIAKPVDIPEVQDGDDGARAENVEALVRIDPLGLELGYQLIQLVDTNQGASFLSRVKSVRRQLALDLGVLLPPVHITDNLQLKPKEYRILLKGVEVARGDLMTEALMAINPGHASANIEGVKTTEPTFNLPALWIKPADKEKAQLAGYTVVDNTTVLATHLTEVIKSNIHELLGRQDVNKLVDQVNETHPKVIEELIPKILNLGQVQKVLQNLLRERVSIRDMVTILETLADYAPLTKNVALLTEYARQSLGRSICQSHINAQGELRVVTLSAALETIFSEAVTITEQHSFLALDPHKAGEILQAIQATTADAGFEGYPVLLTTTEIRFHVRQFLEHLLPNLTVVSHNEIPLHVKVISLGVIEI